MAQREATIEDTVLIEVRHLLIGMAESPVEGSTAAHVLRNLGLRVDKLRVVSSDNPATMLQPELSDGVKRALERAVSIAVQSRSKTISSAHLLYSLLEDKQVDALLMQGGLSAEQVRKALMSLDDWTDEP